MLKATVSGSFHRHMPAIYEAVGGLRSNHVDVLSPSDPRVVDNIGEFLFVASDRLRSIRLVQDRHIEAIRASDFLWVVCPDGYTGPSTCMEIGAAVAAGVPIFACSPALDITVGEYVERVGSLAEAIALVTERQRPIRRRAHVLIDPEAAIDDSLYALSELRPSLIGASGNGATDAERQLRSARQTLGIVFGLK